MIKQTPRITLSMIVKDEEKYLRECLESVKGIADEIVIVDTGSTDNTIDIAKQFGAEVYHYEWKNDFSDARNYALKKSNGKWILYLDADERLLSESVEALRELTSGENPYGVRCLVNNLDDVNGKPKYMRYTRLFKNNSAIGFTGAVHEQIDNSLAANGYKMIDSDIEIIHVGYNVSNGELKRKARRNLELLLPEYAGDKSAYNAYQLANTYSILEEHDKANERYLEAVGKSGLNNDYKAHAYLNISGYEYGRQNMEGALEYLNLGLKYDKANPLLNLLASDIYFRLNKKSKSLECCQTAFDENKKILAGNNRSALSIGLKPATILCKGIYYSLLSGDKNKLQNFLSELKKDNDTLFAVMRGLLNNKPFGAEEIIEFENLLSADNIDPFLLLLENYGDKKAALEILRSARNKFKENAKFLKTLGLLYSENNFYDEAVSEFEESLSLKEKEPSSVFYLVSLLVRQNMLEKLPDLLLFAEKEFGNIPEFNANFEILKQKLNALFAS